jgi:hypothetical protein
MPARNFWSNNSGASCLREKAGDDRRATIVSILGRWDKISGPIFAKKGWLPSSVLRITLMSVALYRSAA